MHGPKWPFLLAHGPCVVVVNCGDGFCTLGRAPRTKETLPDFHEWCPGYLTYVNIQRVNGLSTDPREMGRHSLVSEHRYTTT